MKRILLTLAVSLAFVATGAQAQITIAQWTFEVSQPSATNSQTDGPHAPELGAGAATAFHASTATDYSNPTGNGSLESWSANTWVAGDYYQFQISSVGLDLLTVSWSQTRSSTGPGSFELQTSTDGTSFTQRLLYDVPVATWSSTTVDTTTQFSLDISSLNALDNQATVYFRLTSLESGSSAAGSNRVDDFTVTGIPEPATFAMLLSGFGILFGIQRFRRRS